MLLQIFVASGTEKGKLPTAKAMSRGFSHFVHDDREGVLIGLRFIAIRTCNRARLAMPSHHTNVSDVATAFLGKPVSRTGLPMCCIEEQPDRQERQLPSSLSPDFPADLWMTYFSSKTVVTA